MIDAVESVLAETPIDRNPYLASLADGSLSREDFLETQAQFYYAVVFFSRPMAALVAKIPTAGLRVEILRNVWEEHGEGDLSHRHGATFLELLNRLGGLTQADVEARALWPEVRAFNAVLAGTCMLDDWEVGAGMLGMIERMFSTISARIGRGITARGFLTTERLIHYKLHEELDVRHSDDFFAALRPTFESGPRGRQLVEQGLRLGAYVFDRLYRDLFAARGRRLLAAVPRPQERIYAE